jgi:protease-4
VAQPSTLTGSIGVFGGKIAIGGTMEKLGMTAFQFKRGELADLFSSSQPFSDAGRAVFRGYLQGFYDLFVHRVAEGRRRSFEEIHTVAQGRVWTGEQAKENGLVDELGGLDVALKKAAELGKIEGEYGLRVLPRQRSFIEQVMEDLAAVQSPTIEITPIPGAEHAVRELVLLQQILGDDGVAAYWPGAVEVR